MFIKIKTSANSKGKSVQIVQLIRKGERVTQKIIRHTLSITTFKAIILTQVVSLSTKTA